MAATFNLVRNSRVWFTTNVDPTSGAIYTSSATTTTNTMELTVLDGFSFSQGTQQSTIQLSEAGNTPVRGQRSFNTSLDPVDFSFSTYIRPAGSTTTVGSVEEEILWNALMCVDPLDATGTPIIVSTITRTATNVATATVTCTAVNLIPTFGSANAGVGGIANISGMAATVTGVQQWSGPVKLLSVTTQTGSGSTSVTVFVVEYLSAPVGVAATAAGVIGTAKLTKCAWNTQTSSVTTPAYQQLTSAFSNKNQLQKFGMYFLVDNAVYSIDNCVLDSATVDFGLDGIATVAWTGKGTSLNYISGATITSPNPAVFGGTGIGPGTASTRVLNTASKYITNKLSTMTLISKIMGADTTAGTAYTVPLTGGSITIANNVNYVIPANLGVVNKPIGYFTGNRSISGSVTAYLKVGTGNSADLLTAVLGAGAETKYKVQIEIGGSSNALHVDMLMNGCVLQVPTVETGDVMSTTINFTAQGYEPGAQATVATNAYDIGQTNDLSVYYYPA